jgi:hypothetical protein
MAEKKYGDRTNCMLNSKEGLRNGKEGLQQLELLL